jgi:hypothetical protein
MSAAGCRRSGPFPIQVQPAEFAVYHAFILHYAENHPQDEQQLYVGNTASSGFLYGEADIPRTRKAFEECLSPKAHAAFVALQHPSPNDLGGTSQVAWRTLPDGKLLPLNSSMTDPAHATSIAFSRVFFETNGNEGYVNTGVKKCNVACGGGGMLWHVFRDGNSWAFNPTKCNTVD